MLFFNKKIILPKESHWINFFNFSFLQYSRFTCSCKKKKKKKKISAETAHVLFTKFTLVATSFFFLIN